MPLTPSRRYARYLSDAIDLWDCAAVATTLIEDSKGTLDAFRLGERLHDGTPDRDGIAGKPLFVRDVHPGACLAIVASVNDPRHCPRRLQQRHPAWALGSGDPER